MAAPPRLDVAAPCPACAAPLDFTEGASCARCTHCGMRLLLPGRRHVLTYWVPPRTDAIGALAAARAVAPGARDPELAFLPYYRFTAQELRWEWPMRPGPMGLEPDRSATPLFAERVIERNFLGCTWDGLNLHSIGVRTSALRLSVFRAEALPDGARVAVPELSADVALARALRGADDAVAQRAVVCGMLGLVYFPCWIVALGGADGAPVAIVDGVSGALVARDAPRALLERLGGASAVVSAAIACRPLACPNCGWDLPDDSDHVVFFCAECGRAWALDDSRLVETACAIAATPAGLRGPVQHLPMWIVEASDAPPGLRRIAVPAFRYPSLRLELVLAAQLTRARVDVPAGGGAPSEPLGATFDRQDALGLARFVAAGLDRDAAARMELATARLVWWPFERLPGSLREPVTRFALQGTPGAIPGAARPPVTSPAARSASPDRSGS